jgi:hypothetical protein
LIIRIYRELKKLNSKKINDTMKKWANEVNRAFSKEEVQMAEKYMKKCSPFLAIKEMQIKTMLRFHLTPVKMVTMKNTTNNKCWPEYGEKETLIHSWWECELVQPLWKRVWRFLQKVKIELLHAPAILPIGIYQKKCKSVYNKGIPHPCLLQYCSQ